MAKIICTAGPNLGDQWELKPGITTIGRHASNAIVLHDTKVSRNHATLKSEGDKFVLEDLGSLNGTQVFGKRVSHAVITMETPIQLGNTTLLLTRKSLHDVGLQYVEAVHDDLLRKHKSKRAIMSDILRDLGKTQAKPAPKKSLWGNLLGGREKPSPPVKRKTLK